MSIVFKIIFLTCVGVYAVSFFRALFCSDETSRAHAMVTGSISAFVAILSLFGILATSG